MMKILQEKVSVIERRERERESERGRERERETDRDFLMRLTDSQHGDHSISFSRSAICTIMHAGDFADDHCLKSGQEVSLISVPMNHG